MNLALTSQAEQDEPAVRQAGTEIAVACDAGEVLRYQAAATPYKPISGNCALPPD